MARSQINFRVSPEEKRDLQAAAREHGFNLTTYLRALAHWDIRETQRQCMREIQPMGCLGVRGGCDEAIRLQQLPISIKRRGGTETQTLERDRALKAGDFLREFGGIKITEVIEAQPGRVGRLEAEPSELGSPRSPSRKKQTLGAPLFHACRTDVRRNVRGPTRQTERRAHRLTSDVRRENIRDSARPNPRRTAGRETGVRGGSHDQGEAFRRADVRSVRARRFRGACGAC